MTHAPVRAPRGTELSCRGWQQEAALRMLMNNLDPEVAEKPEELIIYGGSGKAARNWECYEAIVAALRRLADDETLLVQSGKPVGVFRTHPDAPRVLIANSLLVPHWATADEFRRLEGLGLTMFGQMTAGSWIYIGTQGILQGTYQTFVAIAEQRFGGSLRGTLTLTAGLGGMGGAQPLAITMNDGVALCVEVDPERITRRIEHRYLDEQADSLDDAVDRVLTAKAEGRPLSVYGSGSQTRAFIHIEDVLTAIQLATGVPPARGERVRIVNQVAETSLINALAERVSGITGVPVAHVENPRREPEGNEFEVDRSTLSELGFRPRSFADTLPSEIADLSELLSRSLPDPTPQVRAHA